MNVKIVTIATATWAAVSFLFCVVWGILTPESWHMHGFLEIFLPGFRWLSWMTFSLGLIESFLFGAYAGFVFALIYNFLNRRVVGRDASKAAK